MIDTDGLYSLIGAIIVQAAKDSAGAGAFMEAGDQQSATAFLDAMELPQHTRDRIVAAELDRRRTAIKPGGARKHQKAAA